MIVITLKPGTGLSGEWHGEWRASPLPPLCTARGVLPAARCASWLMAACVVCCLRHVARGSGPGPTRAHRPPRGIYSSELFFVNRFSVFGFQHQTLCVSHLIKRTKRKRTLDSKFQIRPQTKLPIKLRFKTAKIGLTWALMQKQSEF